jgi:hypothetical protein
MLVFDNSFLKSGFVMPYSMNIDKYSIFFLDNADINILVFFEIFPGNKGFYMVSHLMFFLHSAHPFHLSSSKKKGNPISSFLGL